MQLMMESELARKEPGFCARVQALNALREQTRSTEDQENGTTYFALNP